MELHPPKRYVQVLTPSTFECDLIWKSGLCKSLYQGSRGEILEPGWVLNLMTQKRRERDI